MILIEDHDHKTNPDIWFDPKYIQILHDDFPSSIARYKINCIKVANPILTIENFRSLRKVNLNVSVTTSDGTSYMTPGGGVACSGYNIETVMRMTTLQRRFNQVNKSLNIDLPKIIQGFHTTGKVLVDLKTLNEDDSVFEVTYDGYKKALIVFHEKIGKFKTLKLFGISSIDIDYYYSNSEGIVIKFSDFIDSGNEYIIVYRTLSNQVSLFKLSDHTSHSYDSHLININNRFKPNLLTKALAQLHY